MLKIDINNRAATRAIREIRNKVKNFNDAFEEIRDEVEDVIEKAFSSERSPNGSSWEPLSRVTVDRYGSSKLLQRSGRLKSSIRVKVSGRELIVEAKAPYAAVHQYGNRKNQAWGRGRAPIPARPYLPITRTGELSDEMMDRIRDILDQYFDVEAV